MEARLATLDDVNDLFLLNALFENKTTIELLKKSLVENNREVVCIAFVDGTAAGYCTGLIVESMCYSQNRADIESLYVRDEYRNQGVGRALMTCLEEALAARGICHFHIVTRKDNKGSSALYTSLGYNVTGEILFDKTIC